MHLSHSKAFFRKSWFSSDECFLKLVRKLCQRFLRCPKMQESDTETPFYHFEKVVSVIILRCVKNAPVSYGNNTFCKTHSFPMWNYCFLSTGGYTSSLSLLLLLLLLHYYYYYCSTCFVASTTAAAATCREEIQSTLVAMSLTESSLLGKRWLRLKDLMSILVTRHPWCFER